MIETILKEKLRIEKLKEIKKTETPIMTGVRIPYKGEDKEFDVYRIPLRYLVYNPYNGRIGTKVRTFEVNSHKLNPEDEEDVKIIEKYLWDSKIDRNKKTMESLIKYKQKEYGIVSRNGYIIDGNRRASLLNEIFRKRNTKYKNHDVSHCEFFNAIILDDDADKKEILRLETTYQMGMDEKLDYNATEKYLKCKQLLDEGYTTKDIAEMMDEKESTIKKNLEILKLMDEYLEYYDYKDMYSMLEKREGQFVDLSRFVKSYEEKSGNAHTNWDPDLTDITEMVSICFDYIRAQYEGKEFRNIAQNSRSSIPKGFFANKTIWEDFKKKHENFIDEIEEEPVTAYTDTKDGSKDISTILAERDDVWTNRVINKLTENMNKSKRRLEDTQAADKPAVLLKNAIDAIELIDTNQETFYTSEVINLVNQINSICWDYKKIIQKELRKNG
ncbi:hypothetical protein GA0061096_1362 [Fictibacillus enclensis]|uniref:ParB/Sulfiredoxin domain-containing protein n=1 Tax=Fictibacillus enclensis TaxID=1017270 RepID=A0A0V8JET3_9BACL|nr:hypothetical protein [Fictibacillus enclensis]KSU85168.1 hypothetical protein AS030_06525 [Fictibacillus enclensis]SCB92072.1 hypothetical protein GA0061096_1362 [Fictibacillus enclensis]